jgi:hypothetical protein
MPKKTITLSDIIRVFGECEIQDERGIWMPVNEDWKNKQFDIDLDFGKITEKKLAEAFEGKGKIEVKTERWQEKSTQWKNTKNIAIEFRCRGKLSGLSTTESEFWIHMLDDGGGGYIFETEYLKKLIRKKKEDGTLVVKMIGDDNASECAILPMKELFLYKDKKQKELFT